MKHQLIPKAMAGMILAALLAACGGGGGSSTAPATTLSGTAATGAPFAGATVSIVDKTGTVVGSGTTAADGSYTITLSIGATPPFVLKAVRDDLTLVSVAADTTGSTFNITPITNLIASRLSTSGDPAKLAAEFQANPDLLSSIKVSAKVDEIIALLKPLLDAIGVTANPLTGKFAADGTGSDRVLDSLSIKITPDSATTSNIEVSIKQQTSDDAQPVVVRFTNATTTPPALPAIAAGTLLPSGTALLIADLMQRITACFALPVAERVDTPNAVAATAANIKASACKTIFHNNDPATFKSNGKVVGTGSNTAFNGIFRTGGNGIVFDRGSYEFTRANGDLVIGYRNTDSAGNVQNDSLAVRLTTGDNKLRLIGNQYAYDGAISAFHQLRTFVNQPAASYYSTGYLPAVVNNGLFSKVVVTSPKGGVLTLLPTSGSTYLNLQKNGVASTTSFLRVRGVYVDSANSGNPADADTSLVFTPVRATDAEIAEYAAQGNWKFDYYLTGNVSATPNATQYYKTRARAMTINELKTQGLATLSKENVTSLQTGSAAIGTFPLNFTGPVILDWSVPAGALEPTSIKVFGFGPLLNGVRKSFDDSASVGSTKRTGSIVCSPQSQNDTHCTTANGVTSFASGSIANGFHLHARDLAGREFANFYATYKVTLP